MDYSGASSQSTSPAGEHSDSTSGASLLCSLLEQQIILSRVESFPEVQAAQGTSAHDRNFVFSTRLHTANLEHAFEFRHEAADCATINPD